VSTSEAVTFAKSVTGFPIDRIAIPIAIAIPTTILAFRKRDERTALVQTFLMACSGSARKR